MSGDDPASHDIGQRRDEYQRGGELTEQNAGDDPIALFERWFDEACEATAGGPSYEPNVMTLATVTEQGLPDARIVLLKSFDRRGFVFYTNYQSRKGRQIAAHPHAALVFYWVALERQVRIEGEVERVSRAESEAYFATRPRGSQLGAWVSEQSETISQEQMRSRLEEIERRFADQPVPCPPHWGGYRVRPQRIEFWQGRPSRLHDRIQFRRLDGEDRWERTRLAP